MTRPVCLVDGSDNRTIIPAYSLRQALSKDTGLIGGNINVDFTSADITDADAGDPPNLPSTILMEPNQAYLASICRLAEVALTQVIVCNVNLGKGLTGGLFLTNVYKLQIADNMVLFPFRLHSDQNSIRFRFLALAVTDNIRVSIMKLS